MTFAHQRHRHHRDGRGAEGKPIPSGEHAVLFHPGNGASAVFSLSSLFSSSSLFSGLPLPFCSSALPPFLSFLLLSLLSTSRLSSQPPPCFSHPLLNRSFQPPLLSCCLYSFLISRSLGLPPPHSFLLLPLALLFLSLLSFVFILPYFSI